MFHIPEDTSDGSSAICGRGIGGMPGLGGETPVLGEPAGQKEKADL